MRNAQVVESRYEQDHLAITESNTKGAVHHCFESSAISIDSLFLRLVIQIYDWRWRRVIFLLAVAIPARAADSGALLDWSSLD